VIAKEGQIFFLPICRGREKGRKEGWVFEGRGASLFLIAGPEFRRKIEGGRCHQKRKRRKGEGHSDIEESTRHVVREENTRIFNREEELSYSTEKEGKQGIYFLQGGRSLALRHSEEGHLPVLQQRGGRERK